jgi:hypothetical protein
MNAHSYAARKDAMPRDLRISNPDSGKLYDVEPEAFEKFKRILAEKETASARTVKGANMKSDVNDQVDLTIYPAEVVAAAKVEAAKPDKRARRYGDVFTPEVVAVWQAWKEKDGRSITWIGKHNGLLEVPETVVHTYMFKHKQEAAALRSQKKGQETAMPSVAPKAEPVAMVDDTAVADEVEEAAAVEPPMVEDTAVADVLPLDDAAGDDAAMPVQSVEPFVPRRPDNLPDFLDREYRPVPRVGDTLGNLIRLLNDERVTIEGEVDLRLNIKFGGK